MCCYLSHCDPIMWSKHRVEWQRCVNSIQRLQCFRCPSPECSVSVSAAVGILAAQCAFARGASRVIVIDEHAYRLQRAQDVGRGV